MGTGTNALGTRINATGTDGDGDKYNGEGWAWGQLETTGIAMGTVGCPHVTL